jgi:hypothetical protein
MEVSKSTQSTTHEVVFIAGLSVTEHGDNSGKASFKSHSDLC